MKTFFNRAFIILFIFLVFSLHAQTDDDLYTDPPFWRQALGGAVIGHPVAQVESVVVITDGGNLKSYSWEGRPLWDFYARGRLTPFVGRSREGTSYICRTNGLLMAVNRAGRGLWQVNLKTPIVTPVLTGLDGRLFVFTDKKITCMTGAGYTLWSRDLAGKIAFAPVRDRAGGIILVLESGEVLRYDGFGNVFSYSAPGINAASSRAAPVAAASLEIEGYGISILVLYEDRHMELVYPSLGYGESLRGKLDLPAVPLAVAGINTADRNVVGKKDEAAVLLRDGRIALVSLAQRKILWTQSGHIRTGELPSKPGQEDIELFYDERGIYMATKTGATGFAGDGRRLWYIRLRGAVGIPSFGNDGVLYSGGADWILYAYHLESRVRAQQNLIYGDAPEYSYGTRDPRPSSLADYYFRFQEAELETRFTEIRKAIKDGTVGNNEREYLAWLMEVSESLAANPRAASPPVQARQRAEAVRLLAFIGSSETIPFLAGIFKGDPEIAVKTAAAEAIGKIGVDPEGLALRTFESTVSPPSAALRDEAFLTAVARATGALCRFSGPPLSNTGIRLLTLLSIDDMPPLTKGQATRELRSLGR